MSAIIGIVNHDGRPVDPSIVDRMFDTSARMGSETEVVTPSPDIALAVARHPWERVAGLSGEPLVLDSGDLVVAADASIFYRDALEQRLAMAGVRPQGRSASHLIAAAYRAFGDRCVERLEGDFAFVVYDRERGRIFCARDIFGRRPFFYAELGSTLVVASSVGAVLAHPSCGRELNLAALGSAAANLAWSYGSDTCYQAVRVVPMAGTLRYPGDARLQRYWDPAALRRGSVVPFDQAALELREALAAAVSERMAPDGRTAVWMSGGRDSTAVFAAGRYAIREHGNGRDLVPVSIHYPPGDMGHEDPYIEAVADAWDTPVHWLDIADIPMFDGEAERARGRDEPATSPYAHWNAALARGARECGAHVAFDGSGGDQLFSGSGVYLADLLSGGRWLTLARELRRRNPRYWWHWTIRPLIPGPLRTAVGRLRGRAARTHYLESPLPPWIRRDFSRRHALVERQLAHLPAPRADDRERSFSELCWSLSIPLYGYAQGSLQPRLLETGIEVRSPLMDRRIVELALNRPTLERCTGGEHKPLLAAAMRGLIPNEVLAPRAHKTGLTLSYSRREMRKGLPRLWRDLSGRGLMLADLGVVEAVVFRREVERYLEAGGEERRIALFHTLQTELWLRAHCGERAEPGIR